MSKPDLFSPCSDAMASKRAVLVSGLTPETTCNSLVIYFQSSGSGGGEVTRVLKICDTQAIVQFADELVQKRVLSKDCHCLGHSPIQVEPCPLQLENQYMADNTKDTTVGDERKDPVYDIWDTNNLELFTTKAAHDQATKFASTAGTPGAAFGYRHFQSPDGMLSARTMTSPNDFYPPTLPPPYVPSDPMMSPWQQYQWFDPNQIGPLQGGNLMFSHTSPLRPLTSPPGLRDRGALPYSKTGQMPTAQPPGLYVGGSLPYGYTEPRPTITQPPGIQVGVAEVRRLLEVSGFALETTTETIELFFESRRSGGGEVNEITFDAKKNVYLVEFEDPKVIDSVLAKGQLVYEGHQLQVCVHQPKQDAPMTAIRVSGFKDTTTVDTLEMFFDNPRKSGGDEIKVIRLIDRTRGIAIIDYGSAEVAERVSQKGDLRLHGALLRVELCSSEELEETAPKESTLVLEASGFKDSTSKDTIEFYFENRRRSGGGPLQLIEQLPGRSSRTFKLVFDDKEDAKRVRDRTNLVLDGANLAIVDHGRNHPPNDVFEEQSGIEPVAEPTINTVKVSGIAAATSEDTLENFFENRRKTSGGKIEKIDFDPATRTAVITFVDPSAAERVFQNRMNLKLDGAHLDVVKVRPPKPKVRLPVDPMKVFASNIPESATRDALENFLEAKSGCQVVGLQYGSSSSSVLVTFYEVPDIEKLRDISQRKFLEGSKLSVESVTLTDSIQVHNLPSGCTEDMLENYFENTRKSGGGNVADVGIHEAGTVAVVEFEDHTVVKTVLSKETHEINRVIVRVAEFHRQLGFRHPDDDSSAPGMSIPTPTMVCPNDPCIVAFVCSRDDQKVIFENYMKPLYAEINWDISDEAGFLIECTLARSTPNASSLLTTWKQDVEDAMKKLLDKYSSITIKILQEIWQEVLTAFSSEYNQVQDAESLIHTEMSENAHIIRLTGRKDKVDKMWGKIKKSSQLIEDEFNRKSQEIKETLKDLSEHELRYLLASGFHKVAPKCAISIKNSTIDFHGIPAEINQAKVDMYGRIHSLTSEKIGSTPALVELLSQVECRKHVESKFRDAKLIAVWNIKTADIEVFSTDRDKVREAGRIINQEIKEAVITVTEESKPILRDAKWQELKKQQLNQYPGCLEIIEDTDLTKLTIAATSPAIANVMEVVQDFIEAHTILQKMLPMNNGCVRLIVDYKHNDLAELQKSQQQHFVQIQHVSNQPKTGFIIKGTKTGLAMTTAKLKEIQSKITTTKHEVNNPGMSDFFRQKRGQSTLDGIERRNRCIIEMHESGNEEREDNETDFVMVGTDASSTMECQVDFNDRCYKVIKGDLTKHKVDAIVNAANGNLQHHGGLAGAIVSKGGPAIQLESDQYIRSNGNLLPGHVALTKAGTLPCKYIIHAVGPVWSGGKSNEESFLFAAVYAALEKVQEHRLSCLAIPALSSGVFGFPLDLSALTIVEASKDFFKDHPGSCVKELHFVDYQSETISAFKKALTSVFGSSNVKPGSPGRLPTSKPDLMPEPEAMSTMMFRLTNPNEMTTPSGIVVQMKKGFLAHETADVLVNTVGTQLELKHGAVSASLVKKAGPQLQTECTKLRPNGIKYGDIVDTSNCGLQCTRVYHGACMDWDKGAGAAESVIRNFVSACLSMACQGGYSSIAFPAIGTGNLGYPKDFVARVMYEEAWKFSDQAQTESTLKHIRFVIYDKDAPTFQAFGLEINRLTQSSTLFSKRHTPKPKRNYEPMESDHAVSRGSTSSSKVTVHGDKAVAMIDDVTVQVQQGDITHEVTDGIVNPTNSRLDLTGGAVSKAIVRAGGLSIEQECKQKGRIKHGYAVTNAGKLRCKRIIHLDVSSGSDVTKKLMKTCLKAATEEEMESLAIPALGTRVSPGAAENVASNMFDAIIEHATKKHTLKLVRITIFQRDMVDIFHRALLQKIEAGARKGKGYIRSFIDFVTGATSTVLEDDDERYKPTHAGVNFKLFGDTRRSLDKAIEDIEQCCQDETRDLVLEESDHPEIRKLLREDIQEIESFEEAKKVRVNVETGIICRIRIQGRAEEVFKLQSKILGVLSNVKHREILTGQAEMMKKHVQWMFLEVDPSNSTEQWVAYSPEANLKIESAHGKQPSVRFSENGAECVIDFNKNEERVIGSSAPSAKVKRIETGKIDTPSTWKPMTGELLVVDLNANDPEYIQVAKEFNSSCPATISKIQRIQNPRMWSSYAVHKNAMERSNPAATENERVLYHGTSADTIAKINRQGFNRSFCGKNAVAFGCGVYFAVGAQISAGNQYARPDSNGNKHIYQCRVLTGEYALGNSSMKVPPAKDATDQTILYDSTCNNTSAPTIFVTFNDTQAYPEYLIVFS